MQIIIDALVEPDHLDRLSSEGREILLANIRSVLHADGGAADRPRVGRSSCTDVLDIIRPLLERIAYEPEGGWLKYAYKTAVAISFPENARENDRETPLRDGALCILCALRAVFDFERSRLGVSADGERAVYTDFEFCSEDEASSGAAAEEYRRFLIAWRHDFVYELMRLSAEVTPFGTLEHIAGVHAVAAEAARSFKMDGGCVDLCIVSGAAAGHDIGKFGCRAGERVPYLHYYYTRRWFDRHGLPTIGHIAANHSVWDLEIENLSSESLILVYADFRVKQTRGADGREQTHIYSLKESFDVILGKLDNVDEAKLKRYRYVYAKLMDFEDCMISFARPRTDPALLREAETVAGLKHSAVDKNIRIMHSLTHERMFADILERARSGSQSGAAAGGGGDDAPRKIRAYLSVFEEYFTYCTAPQKEQLLAFLYELLLLPDGNIRRQAASLMGRIIAAFLSGYKKERPADAPADGEEARRFSLWTEYFGKFIRPDRRLTGKQTGMIRYQAKTFVESLFENCAASDVRMFAERLLCHYRAEQSGDVIDADAAFAMTDALFFMDLDILSCDEIGLLVKFSARSLVTAEPDPSHHVMQKAAAMRMLRKIIDLCRSSADGTCRDETMMRIRDEAFDVIRNADCGGSELLCFLRDRILCADEPCLSAAGEADHELISSVFLDNLKTSTPWIMKEIGIEYLLCAAGIQSVGSGNAAHIDAEVHDDDGKSTKRYAKSSDGHANVLHIAAHLSNLIKVSENAGVRRTAVLALLCIAPLLSPERRNEIAVELSKALETGQADISRYIPYCLGSFAMWLRPEELDELIGNMASLLASSNSDVVSAALETIGAMLEHISEHNARFDHADLSEVRPRRSENARISASQTGGEDSAEEPHSVFPGGRARRMCGLLLKGLASYHDKIRQASLHAIGRLFASDTLSFEDKTGLFTLMSKKLLCLISEQDELSHHELGADAAHSAESQLRGGAGDPPRGNELTFYYTAAALSHIYRFITAHEVEAGEFSFCSDASGSDTAGGTRSVKKAAFFPGTFDPFSLSHKEIVREIRDMGFEVYLAIDEFSWSKKAQPSLIRRRIASMCVSDEFDVCLFPHDIPINIAVPDDLKLLKDLFKDTELYLVVGSDVVANASSYKAPPSENSVHSMNHIVFMRSSGSAENVGRTDLSRITGKVIELRLPMHLEDISSTLIRENIDLGRDISNLIDPVVQDFIYRRSLYLREPQYKNIIRVGGLEVSVTYDGAERESIADKLCGASSGETVHIDPRDKIMLLRDRHAPDRLSLLGCVTMRVISSRELYGAMGHLAGCVRERTSGRILLLTGLYVTTSSGAYQSGSDAEQTAQMLLTDALAWGLRQDCVSAVWYRSAESAERTRSIVDISGLLRRSGFVSAGDRSGGCDGAELLMTDMSSAVVLLHNIPTTLKEPFSSDERVLDAIDKAHVRIQDAICGLYPGRLVLSLNAELIYHRLVRMITSLNGVPSEPLTPRVLGPKMCVPFGKILRGNAIPNTVTKTIHTDKVFAEDLHSFTIGPFPGYAPLESQIRAIRSFRRSVILVDDLLDSANRIRVIEPMCRREGIEIDKLLVGFLSGRGLDFMMEHGLSADGVYFIPNLHVWFVESTMYPFIGGDAVSGAKSSVPGLTPSINMILPYAFPKYYRDCSRDALFNFSRTCVENARDIFHALETSYRERYARSLTLPRLNEAVILPLCPDRGSMLNYNQDVTARLCLDEDLKVLNRMRDLLIES